MTTEAKSQARRKFTEEYKRALMAEVASAPRGGQKEILAREKVDHAVFAYWRTKFGETGAVISPANARLLQYLDDPEMEGVHDALEKYAAERAAQTAATNGALIGSVMTYLLHAKDGLRQVEPNIDAAISDLNEIARRLDVKPKGAKP